MRNPIRMTRLLIGVARLTRDLDRLEQVFEINNHLVAMRTPADEAASLASFGAHPIGAAALRDRPRLGHLDLDALRALPATTLGGAYVRFLDRNGIVPASIPTLPGSGDVEYMLAHFYETHDLWHVLTGFDTDPAGELGVQAFLLAQTRAFLPLFVLAAGLVNTALYAYGDKVARLDAIARGWALGRAATPIAGVDWRTHLAQPLADVQHRYRLAAVV
jgi:ubiquinone biosynthesis protein Coq4